MTRHCIELKSTRLKLRSTCQSERGFGCTFYRRHRLSIRQAKTGNQSTSVHVWHFHSELSPHLSQGDKNFLFELTCSVALETVKERRWKRERERERERKRQITLTSMRLVFPVFNATMCVCV